MSHLRAGLYLAVCAALLSASAIAQQPSYTTAGPIPLAIRSAKTIFVSNAGADAGLFPSPFSGDPSRGYTELYADLKADGHFTLVDDPSQADLVLELQLTAPYGPTRGSKVNGASDPVPMFRLVVYDRKTHYILWAFTQEIEIALLQKTHDRNFDDALKQLVAQFETVAGTQPPPPQ
jgi:hypothetical protein